jgi:hypothetical protein
VKFLFPNRVASRDTEGQILAAQQLDPLPPGAGPGTSGRRQVTITDGGFDPP